MKVSTKILIAVLALTIVPLIISNVLITTIGNAKIREENFEFTEGIAKKTGEQIERYLDGLEDYMEGISASEIYKTAARESAEAESSSGKYSEAAERELKGQLATLSYIKAAAVYDAKGNVVAEYSGKDTVAEVIDITSLKAAAADGAAVAIVQTPTKLKRDMLLVVAPIIYNSETVGYMAAESELDHIDKILADTKVGKNGYAYMIADQDRVVSHKDPSRRIALSIFKRENGLASAMEAIFKENEGVKSAVTGRLDYNYSATTVLNGAYYKFINRDLYLMVVRPSDEVVSPISSITGGLNIAMIVIALLAVVTAFVMWHSSQKACDGILSGIEGIKGGRYDLPFNEKTKDEFADIAHEMNELQSRLGTLIDGLAESEKRYKIALDTVSDIVWEYDVRVKKYTFMAKDKAFLGARRVDNTRIDNMPWVTPIKPEVYAQMLRDVENFASGKTNAYSIEYETKDIRGNNVWAGSVGTVVKNKDGQINKIIGSITDITQKKLYDLKVLYLAEYDKLTNVYNRGTIERKVTEFLNKGGEAVKESALFMIDLDNFKNINDTFGHQFGDQILQFVSASIKSVVGEDDLVGRLGGDEFVAFIKCYDDEEQLRDIASRIVKALKSGYEKDGTTHVLSASVGVDTYKQGISDTYKEMNENADFAMYKAKMTGKNSYCIFDDELLHEKEIIDIVSDKIRNLDEEEIIKFSYAPIRCGETRKITSFYVTQTACIKDHPEITIDQLYSIAEKCSRQGELLNTACRYSARR